MGNMGKQMVVGWLVGCFFFFLNRVFAGVEAKADIVRACTIMAVVDNTQMQDQEIYFCFVALAGTGKVLQTHVSKSPCRKGSSQPALPFGICLPFAGGRYRGGCTPWWGDVSAHICFHWHEHQPQAACAEAAITSLSSVSPAATKLGELSQLTARYSFSPPPLILMWVVDSIY